MCEREREDRHSVTDRGGLREGEGIFILAGNGVLQTSCNLPTSATRSIFFKWLMCVCVGGYVHLLILGNTSVAQRFFAINDMVRFAIPICAPTPASIALTTKIAARPASVFVVLLLNL